MKHPLSRYASPPSLACGGRGAALTDRQSRFRGAPDLGNCYALGRAAAQ